MTRNKPENKIRFIDLFAGIGGFHYAFHKHGAECILVSEWDDYARKTYRHNFKNITPGIFNNEDKYFIGDIHNISSFPTEELKTKIDDFNILAAGFPCQPFSQVGKKLGFYDTRGTLFHEIKKILEAKKPEAFFLENVRHLLNHDNGNTIKTIENTIKNLGYSFFKFSVKASDYGLPTHRPRLFMIGFKGDPENKIEFVPPKVRDLDFTMSKLLKKDCYYDKNGTRKRDVGFTLRVGGRASRIDDRRNWEFYWVRDKKTKKIIPHRITVEEAVKLMGFSDYGFSFPDIPETQKMKQLGNSVAVNAVEAYAEAIINHLKIHYL